MNRRISMSIPALVTLFAVILLTLSGCGSASEPSAKVQTAPQPTQPLAPTPKAQEAPKTLQPTSMPPTKAPSLPTTPPQPQATATTSPKPADPNKGVVFSKPFVSGTAGMSMVNLLAKNTSDQVKSFTVKATFKTGDKIAGTAIGAVNDLRPGQTRAVSLISTSPIPSTYDSARIDVDTMVAESKTTPGADIASKVEFGEPSVKSQAGMSTIDVEVTNKDNASHSFTVQAAFLNGEELVGVATGAVNDLAAGQTKTASLITMGSIQGYDKVLMAVETVVK